MTTISLRQIAYARSGDKGSSANIGVIAYTPAGYAFLVEYLTQDKVHNYFKKLGVHSIVRYELPNLGALNFVLHGILDGGGSRCLRIDAQGKALGQAILQMFIEVDREKLEAMLPKNAIKGSLHEEFSRTR